MPDGTKARSGRARNRLVGVLLGIAVIAGGAWFMTTRSGVDGTFADAVATADAELAARLAAEGADPDLPRTLGMTPLMRAVNRNDVAVAHVLIDAGADLAATDPEGLQPVHIAAQADAAESLVLLIRAGAQLDVRSRNGMAPIHHAADAGSARAIVALVQHGVDPNLQSEAVTQGHGYPRDRGATPLGIAARGNHPLAVATLLANGAAVDAPSTSGHTPLQLAIFAGSSADVVILLLDAGADVTAVAACELGCSVAEGDVLAWAYALERQDLIPLLEAAAAS